MGIFTFVVTLRLRFRRLFGDGYRPEKHYMRGPGPMCRRKQMETE